MMLVECVPRLPLVPTCLTFVILASGFTNGLPDRFAIDMVHDNSGSRCSRVTHH
jgi:hypothetical protein